MSFRYDFLFKKKLKTLTYLLDPFLKKVPRLNYTLQVPLHLPTTFPPPN